MFAFLIGLLIGVIFSAMIFTIKTQRAAHVRTQQESIHRLLANERRNRFDVRSMR
ncbi:hypothetical protein ACFOLK_01990 [Marinococcus halophilus]|uniref:Uncharacterized protein n=1 Tax=Marinococcus halophilus TaxID=1371 RepID=A0A510Y6F6_MARHA|nr:hypothetical protein [Marinococcus halophilus]GEK58924.1 hypothetical protein MHA01_18290 [Marinococcus halophilus]